MGLYRSLVVGLLAANLFMVARSHREIRVVHVPSANPAAIHHVSAPREPAPTVVDVSAVVPPGQLLSFVHVQPGEHIASVERHASYTDVTLQGIRGDRRVLLVVH